MLACAAIGSRAISVVAGKLTGSVPGFDGVLARLATPSNARVRTNISEFFMNGLSFIDDKGSRRSPSHPARANVHLQARWACLYD
jgi:hypothetical protein